MMALHSELRGDHMTSHDHNKIQCQHVLLNDIIIIHIMTTGMLADYQLVHYDNNSLLVDLYQSLVLKIYVRCC